MPDHEVQTRKSRMLDDAQEELNITVAVRCRGRNEREIKAKSSVVVTVPDVTGSNEVSINTTDEVGIAAKMNSRTYTVDKVFGPSADQSLIFKEIAEPLFDDFMKGYNCTVLVYGMTSTGKTYTMTGDEKLYDGQLSDSAGIIPRIMFKLFDALEATDSDFLVKCSYIELYNEELKDLLDESHDSSKRLRIFDSSSMNHSSRASSQSNSPREPEVAHNGFSRRRQRPPPVKANRMSATKQQLSESGSGIYVQNVQEFHIINAREGINVLQKGLKHRQVASTKMNDFSSRSHTIFTIMLYKNCDGELFRVSKMNLVDLAGSENISRSGAQNQRAKEAGSINQSLLTLGRVINSLADKSIHIPFRESKLTRLLQDSLGGNTKTALIATISPAKINADETSSTLEYAAKAKNIKNRPQLGALMMKDILVKNISSELAKIKSDFLSTKSKDGIYMSHEHYQEIVNDLENCQTEIQESKRQIESLTSQNNLLLKDKKASQEVTELQNSKIKKLQSTIEYLYDKIERQHHNETELATTIHKLKEALHTMQGSLKSYETHELRLQNDIKEVLYQGITSYRESMNQHLEKVKVSMLDKNLSIKENINNITTIFDDTLKSVEANGSDMCDTLVKLIKETPSMYLKEFNETVSSLKSELSSYSNALTNKLTEISEENNHLREYLDQHLFKNSTQEVLDLRMESVYQKVKNDSDQLLSKLVSMVGAHVEESRTLMVNSMKDTVNEIIDNERSLFQPIRDRWIASCDNINQCDASHQNFEAKSTSGLDKLKELSDASLKSSEDAVNKAKHRTDSFHDFVQKLCCDQSLKKQMHDISDKHRMLEDHFDDNVKYFKESSKGFEDMDCSIKKIIHEMSPEVGDIKSVETLMERINARTFSPVRPTGKTPSRQVLKNAITSKASSRSMSPIKTLDTNVRIISPVKRGTIEFGAEGPPTKKVR
ncbi:ACR010Cp [Eremothecium gossypii ATCC 10895]|uniref:Kinesin-like protein CIN8 n=1 Tax=Eremothecium gossypii (strain ATCC 10895 / CBS 109.51 / FGSC 9923 / NRRL Y-1056) TaxID=284811 RepID=CIN8_EREGS|nr:ACR010Cp [Eremothecium gossypii ATCC 10895]Q8J1G7.1 RecName: Full=Kinesin-like protein CIN8 [Eremothecium gossypii ATCC 10895]AAN87133.1 CIN8 [Eremothecium gossypii]AAS51237.1 ACR010Cp [Eremothecium gossypii ATCC 10895]AEY95528.1 FACR010Cp [Eremothecium gossypii FDAG1]